LPTARRLRVWPLPLCSAHDGVVATLLCGGPGEKMFRMRKNGLRVRTGPTLGRGGAL